MRKSLLLFAALATSTAFADRQQSIDAALALAESSYPGQLELHDSKSQDANEVTLAIKDDPITRIRFTVDSDASECKPGTACEQRFKNAYEQGVAAGAKLKAVNQAMQSCGIRPVAVEGSANTTQFRLVVERELHTADAQHQLDELTACLADFRKALPQDATPQQRSVALRIVKPRGAAAATGPLTFENQWPEDHQNQVSYLIGAGPEDAQLSTAQLRLDPTFLASDKQRERFSNAARGALEKATNEAHVPEGSLPWQTQLDPLQPRMLHTHILACSEYKAGSDNCQADTAVRLAYDLSSDEIVEQEVLHDVVNDAGWVDLPLL